MQIEQLEQDKYIKWLNNSVWLTDETLTDTVTSGQIRFGTSGNEEVLHIPQIPRTGASPLEECHI